MPTKGERGGRQFRGPHRGTAGLISWAPLQPRVLYDIEQCVRRFAEAVAAGGGSGFAEFSEIWRTLRPGRRWYYGWYCFNWKNIPFLLAPPGGG